MKLSSLIAQANPQFGQGLQPPSQFYSAGSAEASGVTAVNNLEAFISNLIGVLTLVGGLMFIFYFVMGGLNWITAGGEKGKIDKARNQMVEGVIGMIVIVISYGVIGIVGAFLGLNLLQPGQALLNTLNPNQGSSLNQSVGGAAGALSPRK
jgi:hypothetical protein